MMRVVVVLATLLLAGCAASTTGPDPPTGASLAQTAPDTHADSRPSTGGAAVTRAPENSTAPAGPAYTLTVRGICDITYNLPEAASGGTNMLSCGVSLPGGLPTNASSHVTLAFLWQASVNVGDAGLWLWDGNSTNDSLFGYSARITAAEHQRVAVSLDASSWNRLAEAHFAVGAYHESLPSVAQELAYEIEIAVW